MSISSIDQITQINYSIHEVKRELRANPTSQRVNELMRQLSETMVVLRTVDNNNCMKARVPYLMGECIYTLAVNDHQKVDKSYYYEVSFDEHLKSLQYYFQEIGLIDKKVEGNQVIQTLLKYDIKTFTEKLSSLNNKELKNIVFSLGMTAFKYDLANKANQTNEVKVIALTSLKIIIWAINTKKVHNTKRLKEITNRTTLLMHNIYHFENDVNKQQVLFSLMHKLNPLPINFYNCRYEHTYRENIINLHINNLNNAKNLDEQLLELGKIQKTCLNNITNLKNFTNIEILFQFLMGFIESERSLAGDFAESLLFRLNNNPSEIQLNVISLFEYFYGPVPMVDLADNTTSDIVNRENVIEHIKRNIGIVKNYIYNHS